MLVRIAFALTVLAAVMLPQAAVRAQGAPLQPGPGEGLFLIVTDIHFDPFTVPALVPALDRNPVSEWSQIFAKGAKGVIRSYQHDAGYALTVSALQAAAAQNMTYDYVLYTGDYLSHDFNSDYLKHAGPSPQGHTSFAIKTAQYVSLLLEESFGGIPVYGVLGNTDSACGDYEIAPDSPFTAGIADQWATLSRQPMRFDRFRTGGYYKVAHPTLADQDIIVLNNIFWTPRYADSCGAGGGDPGGAMMTWLENELARTRKAGRKAQILMHVPPGINAYSTVHGTGSCDARISPFWHDRYSGKFVDLMRKYSVVVEYTFSGHTHMDSFAIIADTDGTPLVASQITPAVSPVFGNNPAFTAFLYDRTSGAIRDSATFYMPNLSAAAQGARPDWQLEYVYRSTYALQDLSPASRAALAARIKNDKTLRARFDDLYAVKAHSRQITDSNWQAYACAQSTINRTAYETCYCTGN
ncbi:metallophosphoesterase [Labrenzia sp. 011]|uniref:metallophosphoesterase n=1 Tax=Labrenzia sp. 011 TaxID=2171494 RepID=UPI001402CBC9|nr:metallophosphoesterase [Labrenzia sp. 011]